MARTTPQPGRSPTDGVRVGPTQVGHLIQDVARDTDLGDLPAWTASPKRTPEDRLVSEDRVLFHYSADL